MPDQPTDGGSHRLLGLIAQAAGQHNSVVRSFAKAVEAEPDRADWHAFEARTLSACTAFCCREVDCRQASRVYAAAPTLSALKVAPKSISAAGAGRWKK